MGDGSTQEYFIEVEYAGEELKSGVITVDKDAPRTKPNSGNSVVKVEGAEKEKKEEEKEDEDDEERAPWMKIALKEAANYGGYGEGTDPLKSRIQQTYYPEGGMSSTTDPTLDENAWCACFASYVLKTSGFLKKGHAGARYFRSDFENNLLSMRKITTPVYGAIVVWKKSKSDSGHVAFLYGIDKNGN